MQESENGKNHIAVSNSPKTGKIGKRLLIAIVLFSTLITIFTSAVQLYIDFNDDLEQIKDQFHQMENVSLRSLAANVWNYSDEMVMVQLKALVELPAIEYLEIVEDGKTTWKYGAIPQENVITKEFPLVHQSHGQQYNLGTIRVIASLKETYSSLYKKISVIIVTNAIKTFIVALFIFFFFHIQVTKHLLHIAEFTNSLDINKSFSPLKLLRKKSHSHEDELDELVRAINNRTKTLKENHDYLEKRIAERTEELEKQKKIAEDMARTDSLTGLNNRRAFFEYGKFIESQAIRYNQCYTLLMLDIDHFKNINDNYGHDKGDEVLKALAVTLHKGIRTSDIVGRLGGEEFAIIMPLTTAYQSTVLVERLRRDIGETVLYAKDQEVTFTVSVGIAQYGQKNKQFQQILNNADHALYQAKEEGRNTYRIYLEDGETFLSPSLL